MLVCGCLWVCVYVLSLYGQDLALYQRFNYYYYVHTLYKRQRGNYIKKSMSLFLCSVYISNKTVVCISNKLKPH